MASRSELFDPAVSAFNRDILDRSQVVDIKQSIKSDELTSIEGVKQQIRSAAGGSSSSQRGRAHSGAGLNRRLNRQTKRKGIFKILAGVAIVGGALLIGD